MLFARELSLRRAIVVLVFRIDLPHRLLPDALFVRVSDQARQARE
jgi:hypothetical protein